MSSEKEAMLPALTGDLKWPEIVERYEAKGFSKAEIADQLRMFVDYWTEKSPNGKKMRWQKETVFDPRRRLDRWFKNKKDWAQERGGGKYEVGRV